MNILLIEDDEDKIRAFSGYFEEFSKSHINVNVEEAKCLKDATRKILTGIYDLIIFDVYLPLTLDDGSEEIDASEDIITEYKESKNYQCESIAITKYDTAEINHMDLFNENGVTVVHYADDGRWKLSLELVMTKLLSKVKYDFLIFCALNKERSAYDQTDSELGDLRVRNGLDCQEIHLGDFNGLCIVPTHMGLVGMAITASKAIEAFQPKIICMSGICAGVEGEVALLDLIVGNICWEYQTGKFKDNKFLQEPYQAELDSQLEVELRQYIESQEVVDELKKELHETELKKSKVLIGPISSGSAVIASSEKMDEIGMQHRKMLGVEMEMYSLYEAAKQSQCKPLYFGAKCVVDYGNASKGDSLHNAACILSARFVISFLQKKLPAIKGN